MSVARVRGIEMAYTLAGEGATVVALLHGFPFNRSMWDEQAEALRGRYRVLTPDLRGHGETGLGGDVATMEEMAWDVSVLLDELGIERVVLGGLSMGGYVTLAFRRLYPQRVRALVLADTRATPDTEEARRGREKSARKALAEGMTPLVEAMLPKMFAPATFENRPRAVERVREMMSGTKPQGAAAALRGMAVRRDQTDMLREIDVPALVVVGEEDSITPPADAEALHREIRGSRLARIEGAGHVSNLERPAEFNRALSEFLETHGS